MLSINLLITFAFTICNALDFDDWHPPGASDIRGPCPGLNTLANHGFISRNGKGITVPMVVKAQLEVYNISTELATIVALGGLMTSDDPSSGAFNLDDLDKHNVIEHDASLSRADINLGGDDHTFRQDIFDTVLAFFNGPSVTIPAAALARYSRVLTERYRDPNFFYGPDQQRNAYLETTLYLLTMVDPKTGLTPVEFIRIFFEQERLPYKEGWQPPKNQINGFVVAQTVLQLALATPEKTYSTNVVFSINQANESPSLGSMERPLSYERGIQRSFTYS
ncbi:Cloroperoxidase [Glonium stellatum]|uniref:Cloroperoxidase n=1 Tax=Glonium stellatum TaxID=574774 RepID=A0A8E2EZW6_9PEZI|nr:Cloroperoxidase [Glonium stellatum]